MLQEPTLPTLTDQNRAELDDELLAIRCQLGERAAFDALIDRWHTPLWKYVRRLAGHDETAADALQEVWLRVLRAIPALRDPSRLRPFLFGIARRTMMDRLREKYAEPEPAPVEMVADLTSPETSHELMQELALMRDELSRMPLIEREVLVLFYLQELSLNQLAEVLAVPVGTVKSRLFRARQTLRRQLTGKGVQP
jgi:RNA polymerase sigma-70 factor (ECF subfamily)